MVVAQDISFKLNDQQQNAVDFVLGKFKNGQRLVGLYGAGGTGKSFCSKAILDGLEGKTLAIAPTNTAAKLLSRALSKYGTQRTARTIASALGLIPDFGKDGELIFEQGTKLYSDDDDDKGELETCRNLIIDEGSMIAQEQVKQVLERVRTDCNILVLMDKWQLPAVNEKEIYLAEKVGDCHFELTQTMRYKPDSYIYKVINSIRQSVISGDKLLDPVSKFPATHIENPATRSGYYVQNETQGLWTLVSACRNMLKANLYDYVRAICWRRKEVTKVNDFVRSNLFFEYAEHLSYIPGELLITTGSVKRIEKGREFVIYPTSTNLIVERSVEMTKQDRYGRDWNVCRTYVFDPDDNSGMGGQPRQQELYLINKRDRVAFYQRQADLGMELNAVADEFGYKSSPWYDKLKEKKAFDAIVDPAQHSYAITAHGSQGMSLDISFVKWSDMQQNRRDWQVRNRCAYVGVSRARSSLVMF